jgi:predicted transcriptional regulator
MITRTVTIRLPESLYTRLQQIAQATRRPLDDVLLHALQVGSPPSWEDAPAEFQADLAALDRLEDEALWRIARSRKTEADMERYQELLDKNANDLLTPEERDELTQLRTEFDRFMLRKAHAVALLRWRGYQIPPAETLLDAA